MLAAWVRDVQRLGSSGEFLNVLAVLDPDLFLIVSRINKFVVHNE